jgi:hypothetical protein
MSTRQAWRIERISVRLLPDNFFGRDTEGDDSPRTYLMDAWGALPQQVKNQFGEREGGVSGARLRSAQY